MIISLYSSLQQDNVYYNIKKAFCLDISVIYMIARMNLMTILKIRSKEYINSNPTVNK